MTKEKFNLVIHSKLENKGLKFACDRSNYIDGWNDCIREIEKVTGKKLENILEGK